MMGNLRPARLTLPIALLRAREVVMDLFRPMLHAHGATEQQWRVLSVIREAGATDATALARNACILAPSLSRVVRTLEVRGMISLGRDMNDARRGLIGLTPCGEIFIAALAASNGKLKRGRVQSRSTHF
ncbi:MAG: MarR family transcriptional regulator [Notoacmeibacter sp.]|nr:MarR family transcriptional regulator [Notoacmeibacter sp.]